MDVKLQDLFEYLNEGVSPFHAAAGTARRLEEAGFEKLEEGRLWALQPGGRYYLTRNGSSLIAFWLPAQAQRSRFTTSSWPSACIPSKKVLAYITG